MKPEVGPRPRVFSGDRFDANDDEGTWTRMEIKEARK